MSGALKQALIQTVRTRRLFLRDASLVGGVVVGASLLGAGDAAARQSDLATPVADVYPAAPLPSWNEGPRKEAILDFLREVTDPGSPHFAPDETRIATFDMDGTLWVSHPIYTQIVFILARIDALAADHPEWKTEEPFKSILTRDLPGIEKLSEQQVALAMNAVHAGMTIPEYQAVIAEWLATARHPRFKVPYPELFYVPMAELVRLFQANNFKTYIVSGTDQNFTRVFAEPSLGIIPEQVIGSTSKTRYDIRDGKPELFISEETLYVDNNAGKAEAIQLTIGRRPLAAFGNSDGDLEMLQWTFAGEQPRLAMFVHHDDAVREYAYDTDTKVGTLSQSTMDEAERGGWHLISMKDDWNRMFSFDER